MLSFFQDPSKNTLRYALAAGTALIAGFFAWRCLTASSATQKTANRKKKKKNADAMTKEVTISEIYVHPVKGCAAVPVQSAVLTQSGFQYDREWCVLSADGKNQILTQRELPQMRLISATISADGKFVLIKTPLRATAVAVPIEVTPEERLKKAAASASLAPAVYPTEKWAIPAQVMDEGDEAAAVLTEFLLKPCRLCRNVKLREPSVSGWHKRVTGASDRINLNDYSALHIVSQESIDAVQKSVSEARERLRKIYEANRNSEAGADAALEVLPSEEKVDALRWRPNIVVKGVSEGFEEDFWKTLEIRAATINDSTSKSAVIPACVRKHCGRCSVPTVLSDGTKDKSGYATEALRQSRNGYYVHQRDAANLPATPQKWPMLGLNVALTAPEKLIAGAESAGAVVTVGDKIVVNEFETENVLSFDE